jgi:hypothetical protein
MLSLFVRCATPIIAALAPASPNRFGEGRTCVGGPRWYAPQAEEPLALEGGS